MTQSHYEDTTEYTYVSASGVSSNDCMMLGYRSPVGVGLSPTELESWVIHFKPAQSSGESFPLAFEYGGTTWMTGLWKSLAGPVYVSGSDGSILTRRSWKEGDEDTAWEEVSLDARLYGVWGLSDENVFTWGERGDEYRMFRYDGRKWSPMPSPGNISFVHGLAPDFLYAAGYDGLMARWNGQAWTPVKVPTESNFTGLFVAGPNEMYATTEAGELLEGTAHGWALRAESPDTILLGVAKYKEDVWVAGGEEGLLRLKGNTRELEVVKPTVHARSFDVRRCLLITTPEMIVQSDDGVKFRGSGRDAFKKYREKHPPLWETEN